MAYLKDTNREFIERNHKQTCHGLRQSYRAEGSVPSELFVNI